jgi:TonB family protein
VKLRSYILPSFIANSRPQEAATMRIAHHVVTVLLGAMFASCASRPPLPDKAKQAAPARLGAVLLPGCLLPAPSLLGRVLIPRATLTVAVDAMGDVSSAVLAESTGNAELDAALQAAMLRCHFSPAYEVDQSTHSRKEVSERRTVDVSWLSPAPEYGPHRCVTPDYPHVARRAGEEGRITVVFRKDSETGQVVSQLRPDSAPFRTLRALTLTTIAACMAHDEARSAAPADKWVSVSYEWRLQ